MVWRHFTAGMSFGKPLAEWAYATPDYPDGLRVSDLQVAAPNDQLETARFWFLSNYEPFPGDGRWFGFGEGHAGWDQGTWAPPRDIATHILDEEFADALRPDVLFELSGYLNGRSAEWIRIQGQPPGMLPIEGSAAADLIPILIQRLQGLESEVKKLKSAHGNLGHNQGPSLLSDASIAQIEAGIAETQLAIEKGPAGASHAEEAASIFKEVQKGLIQGFAREAGEQVFDLLKPHFHVIFHYINEIISLILSCWPGS
jgi:hypothetical protein